MNARKHEAHMSNEERLAVLETTILNINATLVDIRHQFDRIDARFDAMERKFDGKFDAMEHKFDGKFDAMEHKFDVKFDAINNRLWSNFLWLAGMIAALAGLIAHTQHWI